MEINLFNITYLFIRLAPFILVCYFTLSSVFNQDLKGIIYLIGLLFACFATASLGNIKLFSVDSLPQLCKFITLSNGSPVSNIPLGLTILSYTFFYLFYIIGQNGLWTSNIPTFILFPILIVCDAVWNLNNSCMNIPGLFISFMVGGITGVAWAAIIKSSNITDLQLFNGISNKQTCSRPSKTLYKCTYTKKQQK
jgi:hypothetical protein